MKVIILGSGLLGVSTAYELGKRGFEVEVIDRQPESGMECSFSNGGQLSYSTAEPWATPHLLPKLPNWLLRSDSPLVFRPRADWQMMRWALRFLGNCTPARARINCVNLLRLGLYSRRKMAEIREQTGIRFEDSNKGILHIYGDEESLAKARAQMEFQAKFGCEQRVLDYDACVALEPALKHAQRTITGGIHAVMDEVGDAYTYTQALARLAAEKYGVQFRHGITVEGLLTEQDRIVGVATDQGDMNADGYVTALGAYAPLFLRPIGVDIPVYPMKGYSVTLQANDFCPVSSITDNIYKVVYTRLGDRLRIAGTAEFAGYDTSVNESRIAPILKAARSILPRADWDQEMHKWACLRPSTPDGPPVLGPTPYRNLFLNTGHGTLGWTQAAGSACIVADIMENKIPEIMLNGLTLAR